MSSVSKENIPRESVVQGSSLMDEIQIDKGHLENSLLDVTGEEGIVKHSPYRAYVRTTPQYIPSHGVRRYKNALKSLIPVRRNQREKNGIGVDNAGFFSFISCSWISEYMYKAYKKGLTLDDIPQCSPLDSCDLNAQRLELLWQKEVSAKGPKRASFGAVVWRFIRTRVILTSLIFGLSLIMAFISPAIFMRKLLQYAEDEDGEIMDGVTWAICLTISEFLRTVFFAWNWALSIRTAVRLRSACLSMLYRKVIRLGNTGDKSIGELINLFATDSQRIYDMAIFGPMAIGGPIVSVCGTLYILWLLGPWALLGMIVFLIFYPVQYSISHLIGYLRGKTVTVSDQRVKLTTEILNYIKFIKMYAWEKYFAKELLGIRQKEKGLLQKAAYCQSLSISMAPTIPVISAIVTFLAHITAGNNLTAAQSILLLEDIRPYITRPIDKTQAVYISNGTFSWHSSDLHKDKVELESHHMSPQDPLKGHNKENHQETEKLNPTEDLVHYHTNILSNINFQAPRGQLIGVCGHVGSGKTSLLLAALGQLRLVSGQVTRDGTCAYVSQQPWILNATLKDNILFGENFDSKRYYEAVYSCSLSQDINMLPGGDDTEIGERGINLSGGQKQRVALARAVYANRDIYMLDDPLSAVDTHVGAHIFDKCILQALKPKTVILVTHHLQYLGHCHEVYMMKDGKIVDHGKHEELMAKCQDYAIMIQTVSETGGQEKLCLEQGSGRMEKISDRKSEVLSNSQSIPIVTGSQLSLEEIEKIEPRDGEQLTTLESAQKGSIKFHTYQSYVSAAGGYCIAFIICLIFLLNVGSTAFSSWWLAMWIKAGGGNATETVHNETRPSTNINDNPDFNMYQMVYALNIAVILGMSLLRGLVFTKVTLRASNWLHNRLFNKIITSPMQFFETTPVGRIQNLFSKDMDEVDIRLPITVESIIQNVWIVMFAFLFICLVFPWAVIPLIILGIVYYIISKIFRVAVRDLKRLENISRSPIFSWVGTTVEGLSTIHAFGKENEFTARFTKMFDENTTCLYLCAVSMRWLALRLDTLAVSIVSVTAALIIILHGQVSPALAGLALAYATHISGLFQYTIRLITETEVRFISVERITSYIETLVPEGTQRSTLKTSDWPNKGSIKFQNVSLQYRKGLPLILKGVSFNIQPGEKIGIVGRTGSGKSSLAAALFRLVEVTSGKIKVDNYDIADVNLEHLRSHLSVIPQDPVIFDGTVRSNLDPFKTCSDAVVWEALENVKLRDKVANMDGQLSACIGAGRETFSIGERQLLCLARASLRNSKVLVLDEATAAVDPETEVAVQNTIQRVFKHCTVLTIAHRLSTVTNCDRILVMGNGQVLEMDTPANLMSNPDSYFSRMWSTAGSSLQRT